MLYPSSHLLSGHVINNWTSSINVKCYNSIIHVSITNLINVITNASQKYKKAVNIEIIARLLIHKIKTVIKYNKLVYWRANSAKLLNRDRLIW